MCSIGGTTCLFGHKNVFLANLRQNLNALRHLEAFFGEGTTSDVIYLAHLQGGRCFVKAQKVGTKTLKALTFTILLQFTHFLEDLESALLGQKQRFLGKKFTSSASSSAPPSLPLRNCAASRK